MTPNELSVWLYGIEIAKLRQVRPYRYGLTFTDEAREVFGDASNVMSLGIPIGNSVTDGDIAERPVSFFVGGLLPEGNILAALASRLNVATAEYLPLLNAVGFECAGAIQFLPAGTHPNQGWLEPLDLAQVTDLVEEAPTYPAGHEPQASLAGVQDKILLTRTDTGWNWPREGAPSTHILKPEPLADAVLPNLIEAEHWALSVARAAGLEVPAAAIETFGNRRALVVERYDRTPDGERVHQEDFAQALRLNPHDKYETTVMPNPYRLQRLIERVVPASASPIAARNTLLQQLTFNVLIGNGDAHSKNYSVLLFPNGEARLAPLYDVAPTLFMQPRYNKSGLVINGKRDLNSLALTDLVAEAKKWGMPERIATQTVNETMESVRLAILESDPPSNLAPMLNNLNTFWTQRGWSS